ncbi:sulfatase-like hydrolase/transferase [Nocardioides acrostichi]|uniref:Sulfatase-like hydrolase/transferase n=1 Tax=Nocardioides acrostichi TaxID=2784339 RepID=A0A930UVX2_9ACTN|nr:sulfatase-like hydrolase/transferase [Nocardioides acrostichi]MBF4160060.1 sulfatase-like hydrolase/transferase [Nocardioides acrostichi]
MTLTHTGRRGVAALTVSAMAVLGAVGSAGPSSEAAPVGSAGTDSPAPLVMPGNAVQESYTPPSKRPNILLITTDDMAPGDLAFMPHVRRLIGKAGTTFTNAVAPTPICVPARASLLTGQYAHNHGAVTIGGQGGGFDAFGDKATLPVWLKKAGYDTLFVGKYLNSYGQGRRSKTYVPPGWSDWRGSLDPTTYDFSHARLNINRHVRDIKTYNTTVFADQTAAMLNAPRRRQHPWYLWVNYVAPHFGGPREADDPLRTHPHYTPVVKTTSPAPKYRNAFAGTPLPNTPDMFESHTKDKAKGSPARNRWDKTGRLLLREAHQQRLEALQSVDDAVARHLRILRRTTMLENTIVAFGSDNGYAVGQHNVDGKLWHYGTIAHVPLVMRGPGIPRDARRNVLVGLPDLPVSFAAAARAKPMRRVDGINVLAHLGKNPGRRVLPVEAWPVEGHGHRLYRGVRVGPWSYARLRGGGEELYNLADDPFELSSRLGTRYEDQLTELRKLTRDLTDCAGSECLPQFYK